MTASCFDTMHADKHTRVVGVGTIYSQTVGNTAHVTGLDHHLWPEGEEEPVIGHVRFQAFVGADGTVGWAFVKTQGPLFQKIPFDQKPKTEKGQPDFFDEAISAMRQLSETLDEREPKAWLFSALGAVSMEIRSLKREREDAERAVVHLTKLLADPEQPRETFVDKETGFRPATKDEREVRRADWTRRREKHGARVAAFDATKTERLRLLTIMEMVIHQWCDGSDGCPPPKAYLAQQLMEAKKDDGARLKIRNSASEIPF